MDTVDKTTRSKIMSKVGQKNTGPEMKLRKSLHKIGLRYRLHDKRLPGSPDIVFPRFKAVLFVHGCFWHGHTNCKYFIVPKTRTKWWLAKINRNKANDEKAQKALRKEGWKVINIWECSLKRTRITRKLNSLLTQLQ